MWPDSNIATDFQFMSTLKETELQRTYSSSAWLEMESRKTKTAGETTIITPHLIF